MRTPSVFEVVGPKTFSPLPQVPRYNALLPLPSKRRKSMKSSAKSSALFTIAIISALIGTWVEAQPTPKMPRIGFLVSGSGSSARIASFRTEFLKLGYVEGKNVTFETRAAKLNYDRLPTLADELVRLKVDVIVTPGANDTRAAKNATKTIPVVFLGTVSDPVSLGFVESLARPGGNVTGFTTIGSVLTGKRLELLKDVIPGLSRVALLWNPQNAGSAQVWQESNLRRKNWVCSFIPWPSIAPTNSRARSKRQSKHAAAP
jgi:putative ABC transport system substrate-binding protein